MKNSAIRIKNDYFREEDCGVVVEPLKEKLISFVPADAIRKSELARNPEKPKAAPPVRDMYSEERVAKRQPVVDSSEETLGG